MRFNIGPATVADHKRLSEISRTHRAGQGFTHMMFSGPEMYAKGWIRIVTDMEGDRTVPPENHIVGFTCVRHKKREPKTMLYYVIIDPRYYREGLGTLFLADLKQEAEKHNHRIIELSCLKDNEQALKFYAKHGFVQMGESLKGKGWHLELAW